MSHTRNCYEQRVRDGQEKIESFFPGISVSCFSSGLLDCVIGWWFYIIVNISSKQNKKEKKKDRVLSLKLSLDK